MQSLVCPLSLQQRVTAPKPKNRAHMCRELRPCLVHIQTCDIKMRLGRCRMMQTSDVNCLCVCLWFCLWVLPCTTSVCAWSQGVDILTFGQYLQPTPLHLPVKEHVTPEQFEYWRKFGEDVVGFRYSPMLRFGSVVWFICPPLRWLCCYNYGLCGQVQRQGVGVLLCMSWCKVAQLFAWLVVLPWANGRPYNIM